jgi:fucose permease
MVPYIMQWNLKKGNSDMDRKKLQFVATGLVMMLFGITMVVVGTINNFIMVEFGVDKLFIGLCASVLASGILLGSFVFGPVADRLGYKPVMLAGVVLILIGLLGIIYTSVVPLIPYLFFLIGLGGGMINGVTNVIVAALFPENSSAYLSLLGVFYGIGALGFPLTTSVLLDSGLTYQSILSVVSLFLLIPLGLVALVRFPKCPHAKPIPMKQYFGFFTKPAILLVGLFLFFQSAVEAIVPVWTPTYLKETFLVSYDKGLYAITISALGITLTRLALSQILKKTSPYRVVFISMITIIGGALLLEFGNSFYLGLVGIAMMGIGLAASFPVMLSFTAGFFPSNAGTAFSMVIGIALVGNISLNAFSGYILDTFGIGKLNVLIISFILIMIFLLKIIDYKLLKKQRSC